MDVLSLMRNVKRFPTIMYSITTNLGYIIIMNNIGYNLLDIFFKKNHIFKQWEHVFTIAI